MTSHDYDLVMNAVKIAELKSRLSEFIRQVRAGHTLEVFDRDRLVARIVPAEGGAPSLSIRSPAGSPPLRDVPIPAPIELDSDPVALLLAERAAGS